LPEEFTLRSNGAETRWILGQSAVYSQENYRENAHWYFGKKNVPTRRHVLYTDLYNLMKPLASHHQNEMLQMLRAWSGGDAPATKSNLPMTTSELRDLRRGNLLEVGAHTMSHPVLSTLPQSKQRLEISDSKELLEKIVGEPITGFAYPYGADADYTDETVGIVRDADFESAFSTASGLADNESEMFRLPRNWVRNWTGEQFADRLQRWSLYE
jgi:peptidoglycan/xylan/chitin deacetylase (PgdA/CDA1 family)